MASPLATALMTSEALPRTQIAPTNVAGIYDSAHQAAMERYKAQLMNRNAMWGGLAGIGGAGINAFGKDAAKGIKGLFSSDAPGSSPMSLGDSSVGGDALASAGDAAWAGGLPVADAMAEAAPVAAEAGGGIMATIGELLPFLALL